MARLGLGIGIEAAAQCRMTGHIVEAELRGTNSDLKIGGGLRRNRGGVQRGGVRPPDRVGPNFNMEPRRACQCDVRTGR